MKVWRKSYEAHTAVLGSFFVRLVFIANVLKINRFSLYRFQRDKRKDEIAKLNTLRFLFSYNPKLTYS